jgi:predicted transcriptional regulator
MGSASVSPYQRPFRPGHLERRLSLPVAQVVDTAAATVPPDATVAELFSHHLVAGRRRSVAVVAGHDRYLGLACAEDLAEIDRTEWATTTVATIARGSATPVPLGADVQDALRAMDEAGTDTVAVIDGNRYVGVVTLDGIISLDDVLTRSVRAQPTAG